MGKVRLGVIGLGRMGQVYATHAARQLDHAVLAAVADPRQDALERFASQQNGVRPYTDYHDLLNDSDLQAVIVAAPTNTHRDIVIDAANAGKAIFCEKPTALTLAATREMLEATNRVGVLFQVGFMRRFDRAYAEARHKIDAGVIGEPVMIRSIGRDPYRTSLEYANPAVSGGLVVDMAIHDFDIIRWLMGDEIQRVYAEATSLVYPELIDVGDVDTAMVNIRFESGGLGNIEVSRTAIYGYDIQCEIVGAKGTLQVGYLQETPVLTLTKDGAHHDIVPHFPQRFGQAYTTQIEHFVDCVLNGKPPLVTATDAQAALQASLAATISHREGRVVYLKELN